MISMNAQKRRLIPTVLCLALIAAMLIAAFAIGAASIIFQSVINNRIVTPCLLGMNSLYTLMHTVVYFVFGSTSFLAVNANAAFVVDLVIMVVVATFIYGYLFKKTNYNVLYVLLIGMDPNEYDNLLLTLVAGFDNINGEIIAACAGILALMAFILRKELALLDVITLGKDQAINLGVDYDKTVGKLLIGVTACIAVATAMVGPISFLGLIIANLGRQIMKTYRHSHLILGASLFGMMTLVGGQWIVEHLAAYTVPVSTFITLGGGIYFLYLLLKKR